MSFRAPITINHQTIVEGGGIVPLVYVDGHFSNGLTSKEVSAATGTDTLAVSPFWVPRPMTIDVWRLLVDIAAAGSVVRAGLYEDDGSGYPTALALEIGSFPGTPLGLKSITNSFDFTRAGLYWLGGAPQGGNPTISAHGEPSQGVPFLPPMAYADTTNSFTDSHTAWAQSGVSGALPATFSATKTRVARAPRIFAHVAAFL